MPRRSGTTTSTSGPRARLPPSVLPSMRGKCPPYWRPRISALRRRPSPDFSSSADKVEFVSILSIERGGIRFGLFGVLGREAATYSVSAAPVTFTDPVDAARAAVSMLRDTEKVDQDIR